MIETILSETQMENKMKLFNLTPATVAEFLMTLVATVGFVIVTILFFTTGF
jgi:hypothetical protein